jgi:3-hydroxyacyl-CoA dehydrogenase
LREQEEGRVEIAKVGVVGCGLMGHGITQICAQAGCDVVVTEVDAEALERGIAKIEKQLERAVSRGKLDDGARFGSGSPRPSTTETCPTATS